MGNLFTTDLLSRQLFDGAAHDNVPSLLNALNTTSSGGQEALSAAGACSVTTYASFLTIAGTMAFTLANGSYVGQRKLIMCVAASAIPAATLTITTPETTTGFACSSTFFMDTPGQGVELEWQTGGGVGWRALRVFRAGATTPTVGTTVLTGKNLYANYNLSVTGTVSSTGTQAFPNGSAVGEMVNVGCSTAATIPNGSIDGVYRDLTGTARTHMNGINATTCYATFMWDGQKWQELTFLTVTFS